MIVPLGKHLRKWLLSAAVGVRNRVQTVVAALESAQEEAAGPEFAPGGAKKARPGGPPDHWVQLVERHAPELLQPGRPEVVGRWPSPVVDSGAGLDRMPPEDARVRGPDSMTPLQADQSRLLAPPRAPREYDRSGRKQKTPADVYSEHTADSNASAGGDATPTDQMREGAALHDPAVARSETVRPGPSAVWLAGEEKTMRGPTLDRERHDGFPAAREPKTPSRAAEDSSKSNVVSRGFQSTGNQIENQRADVWKSKNVRTLEPLVGRIEPLHPKAPARSTDSPGAARIPTPAKIKPDAGSDTPPGPDLSSREPAFASKTGIKAFATRTPIGKQSLRPVGEAHIINGQYQADGRQEREKDSVKTLRPAEPRWPGLPGEEEFEDAGGSRKAAAWPDLPDKQSAERNSPSEQMESYRTTAGSSDRERLRRLDAEQKGRSWSASHF